MSQEPSEMPAATEKSFSPMLLEFKRHVIAHGSYNSQRTAQLYCNVVVKMAQSLKTINSDLLHAERRNIDTFIGNYPNPKTKETVICGIKKFYRWAYETRLISYPLADNIPFKSAPFKSPQVLTLRKYELTLQYAEKDREDPEMCCLIMLFAEGGLRPAELLGRIAPSDFDFESSPIRLAVRNAHDTDTRVVELSSRFEKPYKRFLKLKKISKSIFDQNEPLFKFLHAKLNRKFRYYSAKLNFKNQILTPVALRHFCAKRLLDAGKSESEVSIYLGKVPPHLSRKSSWLYQKLREQPR